MRVNVACAVPVNAVLAGAVLACAVAIPSSGAAATSAAPRRTPDRPTSVRVVDGRHDVWRLTFGDHPTRHTSAPGRRQGDITTLRVRQTALDVVVRVHMVEPTGGVETGFPTGPIVQLRTPGPSFTALVDRRSTELVTSYSSQLISCPGARVLKSDGGRTVSVLFPRSCLADPAWVRARAISASFPAENDEQHQYYYADLAPGHRLRLRPHTLAPRVYPPAGAVVRSRLSPALTAPRRALPPRVRSLLGDLGLLGR